MNKKLILNIFRENWGIILALILLNVFFTIASPYYLTFYNFNNMFHHAAFTLIMATGMLMVIATGGIDVSIGSNMALSGLVTANLFMIGMPVFFAAITGLLLGMLIGSINGMLITRLNLQPLIVTLAMLSILRGASLVISGGYAVEGLPENFLNVFAGHGMIKNSLFIGIGVVVIGSFVIYKTPFGIYLKSIGANEDCSYICGINVKRLKTITYSIQGGLAVLGSLVFMASVDAAEPSAGLSTEWMEAIAAPIIGGNHLDGGKANVPGMIIGALILSTIRSGLNIIRVNPAYQQVVMGFVIIIAVIVDALRSSREAIQ